MRRCSVCAKPAPDRNWLGVGTCCQGPPALYDEADGRITSAFDREDEREWDDTELLDRF